MTLPIPTTTVTVTRRAHDPTADAYDPDTGPAVTVAAGVPAHFSGPRAVESADGASQTTTSTLLTDPCDLRHVDVVLDDRTGLRWEVRSARAVTDPDRPAPENDSHVAAEVVRVEGVA